MNIAEQISHLTLFEAIIIVCCLTIAITLLFIASQITEIWKTTMHIENLEDDKDSGASQDDVDKEEPTQ